MRTFLIVAFLLIVVPISAGSLSTLLNEEDFHDVELGIQWQCFPAEKISLDCTEYDYGEASVPTITIQLPFYRYEYDLPVEDRFNCDQTLSEWSRLISDSNNICIYGVYTPGVRESDYPAEWSLWYIHTIKTQNGYWSINKPDF